MKRFIKRFPRLARWLRQATHFDRLLPWCERQAARTWYAAFGWLLEARRRAPRCLPRPRLEFGDTQRMRRYPGAGGAAPS
jgi:hypothetical protein